MGLPPSGGFMGKFLLLTTSIRQGHQWAAVVLVLGGLMASVYVLRMIGSAMYADEERDLRAEPRLHPLLRWVPLVLATIGIALTFLSVRVIEILKIGYPL